jgi:hypothetical protein
MNGFDNTRTCEALIIDDPAVIQREINAITDLICTGFDHAALAAVFADTIEIFEGHYPGYQASKTKYHNLEHTLSVALASARLIHGCAQAGDAFAPRDVLLAIVAALFHDVGLIQTEDDRQGTGAKYTVGHEERSVVFTRQYLKERQWSEAHIEACASMIRCTILAVSPRDIDYPYPAARRLGHIIGSADLLAQIADRRYLEKLLLLYMEFEEARLPGFDSQLDLLQKTVGFYRFVAQKRFAEDLEAVCDNMIHHFKAYCGIDTDLYAASMQKNIDYVDKLTKRCGDSFVCYLDNLKRGGIAREMIKNTLDV